MKIDRYITFRQMNTTFYTMTVSLDNILDNYIVDYYDSISNREGYQRPIQVAHVNKIINYLLIEDNPILNTGIIAAIDLIDLNTYGDTIEFKNKLRIVDGQHRLEAFKTLREKYSSEYEIKFKEYEIMLTVIPSGENKLIEIETFININNKNKRVSTALAEQLLEKIRRQKMPEIYDGKFMINNLSKRTQEEMKRAAANKICEMLNSTEDGVWHQLIKLGDANNGGKVISNNTLLDSLKNVINNYIKIIEDEQVCTQEIAEQIYNIVYKAWKIIEKKWPKTFDIKYYNIQKGVGVWPLHSILAECIQKRGVEWSKEFNKIICESDVKEDDWWIGGRFSAYNSKAGFKEIESIIRNEKRQDYFSK